MLVLQEMFLNLQRGMDNELDNIVTVLAKRSGEVSATSLVTPHHMLCLILHPHHITCLL